MQFADMIMLEIPNLCSWLHGRPDLDHTFWPTSPAGHKEGIRDTHYSASVMDTNTFVKDPA